MPFATLRDLMKVDGKAELIAGKIVRFPPYGYYPGHVAFEIAVSLDRHSTLIGKGIVLGYGAGYAIDPPLRSGRQSFCPDASYYTGPLPADPMKFIGGPPDIAVEMRGSDVYDSAAEQRIADRRNDYFEARTQIVWDVDPRSQEIRSYSAATPQQPRIFKAGDIADAEPALPGWRMAVTEVFD